MEKQIVSFNLAGWAWKASKEQWSDRLQKACDIIKEKAPEAWLIGLQEVIPGKNNKYIEVIGKNFPNYIIVFPKAYENNYRSAVNLLLINREGYHGHDLRTLSGVEDLLLYNYVAITSSYGYIRVINAHIPPACKDEDKPRWYLDERNKLRADYEQAVICECRPYRTEPDIQFFLMGDLNSAPDSAFVKKLSYGIEHPLYNATKEADWKTPTWKNDNFDSAHIDYIFYGMGTAFKSEIIDVYANSIVETPGISDHSIVIGKVRTNLQDGNA